MHGMKICIDELKPGMLLKNDVTDRSGRLLTRAETELTERHINVFKTWGITHADVNSDEDDACLEDDKPLSPQALQMAVTEAQRLFSHNNQEHPAIQALYTHCMQRLANTYNR